ncbi:hypothetical protein MLD38_017082 [Melastoma candidum]|uniref:Uncharacterized protein n=1 Tax=Melastoma candidum TaxID=119954 RepID=A0ACB9QPH9_9MYRT|nr:hypothetical protein MLD38_017082 [Melastoma candidum]
MSGELVYLPMPDRDANEAKKLSRSYGHPPWTFSGSAVYQLHLVKAETARAFVPKELRLVEAFGYTLGGFFLASYDDSPAGVFDELVVIAGIVWNPPTSCAWAAQVLVNSDEACKHGRKEVGLPSHVAKFSKIITPVLHQPRSHYHGFLDRISGGTRSSNRTVVQVSKSEDPAASDVFSIGLASMVPTPAVDGWTGPTVKMRLPSFSGLTQHNPNLLRYSCQIECRVRPVQPLRVSRLPNEVDEEDCGTLPGPSTAEISTSGQSRKDKGDGLAVSVMLSQPILAIEFRSLKMKVEAPTVISTRSSKDPFDSSFVPG